MNKFETQYSDIINQVCKKGSKVIGRNGKTRQITGVQIRANLQDGFPLVTGKQIFPKSVAIELEWMLNGFTNVKYLNSRGVKIWNQWADENGDLGPVYGHQILSFNGLNQIEILINEFKQNKFSRRLLINMWNVNDLHKMKLPPCHYSFQFVTDINNFVDIVVSMRSLDLFIGLPYDMAMYSLVLSSFAKEFNLIAREVIINAANAHIYEEHIGAASIYSLRTKFELPKLKSTSIFTNFNSKDVEIINYKYQERIVVSVKK
jgi:thymidylate synthase